MFDEKDNPTIIIIGRNEGERLRRCLASVADTVHPVVYVDSASTDGSVELAQSMGAEVVELDESEPLSAARARNAGFQYVLEHRPQTKYIQFVDGDCELVDGWIERAVQELEAGERTAIVCGRLRERDRDASIYTRLCDMEWDTPAGEVQACGGIFMIRTDAFLEVGGFNPAVIAGEDDDLCLRLRSQGWKVVKLPDVMALHDAAMTSFIQWWRRSIRSGHCFAQGAAIHGHSAERYWMRERRSTFVWGGLVPLATACMVYVAGLPGLLLLGAYAALGAKMFIRLRSRYRPSDAALYSAACIIGKLPNFIGALMYYWNCIFRRQPRLIEYKLPDRGDAT